MKTKQQKEKQTAVEYLRSIDETINIMESIQDATAREQEDLISTRPDTNYTDDEGVFNMDNLMDVDIEQNAEENTPQLYHAPVEELDDGDKSLITDEFVNMVKNWQDTVIDFSDIGPVATVIQNKLGYRQDIESFLKELINTAVEKQDSQSFAHGSQPVPGMKGRTPATGEEGGPADIAPVTASPTDAAPMDAAAPTDTMDIDPAAELVPELGSNELNPELGADIAPEVDADVAPEAEETEETDSEDDEKDIDSQLEAIREEYKGKKIDAQLESIKNDLLKSTEAKVESKELKAEQVKQTTAAKLESIAANYHAKEDAKIEAVTKEKKLEATLESIANDYHNGEKAKVEAVTKEQKLNATLESLVESYHKDAKKAKVRNASVRDEAKAKIQSISNK